MQKKKIIILSVLLLIIVAILALVLPKNNKINLMQENKVAEYKYSSTIGEKEYDITDLVQEPSEVVPNLSAGMIPIKWDGRAWKITTSESNDWYDYRKGEPAYMMLNDGKYQSKLIRDMEEKNKKLASENIGAQIRPEELKSIYVWIPRYAYNEENNEIIYIKQECTVAGTWKMPSIFTYEIDNRKLSLDGIWVEYNPLESSSAVNTKVTELNKGEADTVYGFIGNTIATNANNEEVYKRTIETYIENAVGNDAHVVPLIANQSNTNRTILKIVNTNKREPIQADINYNEVDKKIEIKVIYTAHGISKILNDYGEEMTLAEENGIILTDTGNEGLVKGVYNFTIIDEKGNQQRLTITPNIDSLFKVAYISGTDNMDNTATYTKATETATSDENMLINQLNEADNSKTYSRAIIDKNKAITAIAQNERTSEDEQVNLYNRYVLNKAKQWTRQPGYYISTSALNAKRYGYSTINTNNDTGAVTLSGRTNGGQYSVEVKYNTSKTTGNGCYYTCTSGTNYATTTNWYYYKYVWTATDAPGDLLSTAIEKEGTYPDNGAQNSYWYKKIELIPKYTISKYDKNLILQSIYDVDTKTLMTESINISNKGRNKVKLILDVLGEDYKTYISNDKTNWQEVTDITSGTPKELDVDGWDKLYIKIETNTSRIDNIDVDYYKD